MGDSPASRSEPVLAGLRDWNRSSGFGQKRGNLLRDLQPPEANSAAELCIRVETPGIIDSLSAELTQGVFLPSADQSALTVKEKSLC
jgi:hypothetical protein